MDLINILLWSLSFLLALVGIIFGIIASVNSTKANKKIQEMISTSWINDESQKFFFDNIKTLTNINRRLVNKLKNKGVTYYDYSLSASVGRFVPISSKVFNLLQETEFKDIATDYRAMKQKFDQQFFDIIGDISILYKDRPMSKFHIAKLIKYHKTIISHSSTIIKSYNILISVTRDIEILK